MHFACELIESCPIALKRRLPIPINGSRIKRGGGTFYSCP
jgi:hypothetical protein